MSERTVIATVEITQIYKGVSEDIALDKDSAKETIERAIKSALDADSVVATNIQEFVREENDSER